MSRRFRPSKLPPSPIKPRDHHPQKRAARTHGRIIKSHLINHQDSDPEDTTDQPKKEE